jgi:hypothetical protein
MIKWRLTLIPEVRSAAMLPPMGTGMPRNHQGAAGIGQLAAAGIAGIAQPAAEKAGHEGIAGAQHVEHFNPHAWVNFAVFEVRRNVSMDDCAALRAKLHHQGCWRCRPARSKNACR